MRSSVAAFLVCAAMLVGGCGPLGLAQGCATALLQGVLIETPGGGLGIGDRESGDPVTSVRWTSYSVREGPPLQLVDFWGTVVATEGDLVGVGGGTGDGEWTWVECGGIVPPLP